MSMLGSGYSAKPSQVRMFLRAPTPEELVGLQLRMNTVLRGQANFTDFSFVKNNWYCWFLVDVDQYPEVLEFLNGTTQKPM